MSPTPHFIKCPITKKNLSVSRDVYNALKSAETSAKSNQEVVSNTIKNITGGLTKKFYTGETRDITIAVKFNERGQVNEFADPTIEFKNSLNNLDPKTKELVENAVQQFLMCVNQALDSKATDMEKELTKTLKPVA